MNETNQELLLIALDAAVPLWIFELQRLPLEEILRIAHECADIVASQGDVIQFRVKGKTGLAFNALAKGLAALAFSPGGVRFMGRHWETNLLD